ncbi:MAG: hypothetical protein AAFZ11_00810 [Pseudomonadota bacterium]
MKRAGHPSEAAIEAEMTREGVGRLSAIRRIQARAAIFAEAAGYAAGRVSRWRR